MYTSYLFFAFFMYVYPLISWKKYISHIILYDAETFIIWLPNNNAHDELEIEFLTNLIAGGFYIIAFLLRFKRTLVSIMEK